MDNLFLRFGPRTFFCVCVQMMLNSPEIVPRNVYDCCSRDDEGDWYVINILGHQWGGCGRGTPPPTIRTLGNLGAKTKGVDALKIEVHEFC